MNKSSDSGQVNNKNQNIILWLVWITVYISVLVWSAINPKDYLVWFLEVLPALLAVLALAFTYKVFPLTPILSYFILIHCVVLMVGGHYTYSEVPLFDYIKDLTGSTRNNYDKVGHFFQGFVPALLLREIIIRKKIISQQGWQVFFTICVSLAISAFYELIEWWVSVAIGSEADSFLGTQGYVWDTQSDMAFALLGAIVALTIFSRSHNKQLQKLKLSN